MPNKLKRSSSYSSSSSSLLESIRKKSRIDGEPVILEHRLKKIKKKNNENDNDIIDITNDSIVQAVFGYNLFENGDYSENENDNKKKINNKKFQFPCPHPIVVKGNENLISLLKEQLYDLNIDMMLENTASENIHVWLKGIDKVTDQSLDSVTVDNHMHAKSLYNAGHSLYCRASEELEKEVIPKVLEELGIGINTSKSDRFRRGEIETFFSRKGHLTDFHVDFQENFTIQLTGKKKWTFCNSSILSPIRGCTPHYNGIGQENNVAEQQLKVLKLGNVDFSPLEFKEGEVWSIILEPGDTLYHPAGVWHKVECIEDSISINISMIAASYAEVICCGLQQILWERKQYRQPVNTLNLNNTYEVIENIFKDIPYILQKLKPSDFLLTFAGDDDDDNDDDDDDESKDTSESTVNDTTNNEKIINMHLENILEELSLESEIRINPLAQVLSEKDLHTLGWNNNLYEKINGDEVYVIHSGFGNEYLESLSQKSIVVPAKLKFAIPHLFRFMKIVKDSLYPSKQLFNITTSQETTDYNENLYASMKNNCITVTQFIKMVDTTDKKKKNNNNNNNNNLEKSILIFISGFIKSGLIVLD